MKLQNYNQPIDCSEVAEAINNCSVYDTGLMFLVHKGSGKAIRKAYSEQLQESGKGHEKQKQTQEHCLLSPVKK